MVVCLERGADLHMAQLMPLPLTVSCFSKIQIGFTCLVPAHLCSLGKGPLNRCVCVCVCNSSSKVYQWSILQLCIILVHFNKGKDASVLTGVTNTNSVTSKYGYMQK